MNGQSLARRVAFPILLVAAAVLVTGFITYQVFGGGSLDSVIETMNGTPDYLNIILVNILIGISVALFIQQLRWGALRVIVTVVVALILGYGVTAFFNLDSAARFTRGEFKVALLSDAQPGETNEDVDLEYGGQRGGEFNKEKVRNPLTEADYRFQGKAGDVVTVLAFAGNRRAQVDLQVAIRDSEGKELASGLSATPEQLKQFSDLRSEKDAVIADFALPADGIYHIYVRPEPVPFSLTMSETITSTNRAYEAFLLGPLGRVNRWAVWLQDALTLILLGLAIAIVFRARQFSLGAEGQLHMGALVSGAIALAWATTLPPGILIPVALIAAMIAGFLWGLIPGVLKAYLGANELVSTLMLNAVGVQFYNLVLTFQLKPPDAGYTASSPFQPNAQLPSIIANTQVTVAVFLVIAAVVAVWLLINRTALGYEIRMVGANRKFADYGGVNTKRTIMLSMAVSGIIAGLAGAHLSLGIFRQLLLNMSIGLAFEGVVVSLLARNNPLVIPFTGLLYSYLRAGAQFMERDANVSFEVVRVIQAVIILLITAEALVAFYQNRRTRQRRAAQATTPVPAAATEG